MPRTRTGSRSSCSAETPASIAGTLPPLLSDERDETTRHRAAHARAVVGAHDLLQQLVEAAADRHDEAPAECELLDERLRNARRGGGDGDRVERRVLRVAARAVSEMHRHAV